MPPPKQEHTSQNRREGERSRREVEGSRREVKRSRHVILHPSSGYKQLEQASTMQDRGHSRASSYKQASETMQDSRSRVRSRPPSGYKLCFSKVLNHLCASSKHLVEEVKLMQHALHKYKLEFRSLEIRARTQYKAQTEHLGPEERYVLVQHARVTVSSQVTA